MVRVGQAVSQYKAATGTSVGPDNGPWKYIGDALRWQQSQGTADNTPSQPEYTGTTRNNSILTGANGDASTATVRRKKLMGSSLLGE